MKPDVRGRRPDATGGIVSDEMGDEAAKTGNSARETSCATREVGAGPDGCGSADAGLKKTTVASNESFSIMEGEQRAKRAKRREEREGKEAVVEVGDENELGGHGDGAGSDREKAAENGDTAKSEKEGPQQLD